MVVWKVIWNSCSCIALPFKVSILSELWGVKLVSLLPKGVEPVTSQKAPVVLTKDEPAPLPSRNGARSEDPRRGKSAGGDRKERIGADGIARNATWFEHNPKRNVNVFVTTRANNVFINLRVLRCQVGRGCPSGQKKS